MWTFFTRNVRVRLIVIVMDTTKPWVSECLVVSMRLSSYVKFEREAREFTHSAILCYHSCVTHSYHKKITRTPTPTLKQVLSEEPTRLLSDYQKIVFTSERSQILLRHSATNEEIQHLCADLQVLGQKDFKNLLKWRSKIRKIIKATETKIEEMEEEEKQKEKKKKEDEKSRQDRQLLEYFDRKKRESRREKKKQRRDRAKLQKRLALGMEKTSIDVVEDDIFSLSSIARAKSKDMQDVRSDEI